MAAPDRPPSIYRLPAARRAAAEGRSHRPARARLIPSGASLDTLAMDLRLGAEFVDEAVSTGGGTAGQNRQPLRADRREVNDQQGKPGRDLQQGGMASRCGGSLETIVDMIDDLTILFKQRH